MSGKFGSGVPGARPAPVFHTWVPGGGPLTVKPTVHWLLFPAASVMVTVMRCDPGPTMVPAGGDCWQVSWLAGVQLSLKQSIKAHKLGIGARQARTCSNDAWRQLQSMVGGVTSGRMVTKKLHEALLPSESVPVQVTMVVPSGHTKPGGVQTTFTGKPQELVATGEG